MVEYRLRRVQYSGSPGDTIHLTTLPEVRIDTVLVRENKYACWKLELHWDYLKGDKILRFTNRHIPQGAQVWIVYEEIKQPVQDEVAGMAVDLIVKLEELKQTLEGGD